MPELPEVEFARGCLSRWLEGKVMQVAEADATRLLRGSPAPFETLHSKRLMKVDRHGKWLLARFTEDVTLAIHLGMTGKLARADRGEEVRHSRARLGASTGPIVHLRDPRQFGRLLAGRSDAVERAAGIDALGPDAWNSPPTIDAVLATFAHRRTPIKAVLMDQAVLAGLGNIQATESLFIAGIHPETPASAIRAEDASRLVPAIHETLSRTLSSMAGDIVTYVEEGGENPFLIYGRDGEPCPRCGTTLESLRLAGRGTVLCPHCQKRSRAAERR